MKLFTIWFIILLLCVLIFIYLVSKTEKEIVPITLTYYYDIINFFEEGECVPYTPSREIILVLTSTKNDYEKAIVLFINEYCNYFDTLVEKFKEIKSSDRYGQISGTIILKDDDGTFDQYDILEIK